MDALVADSVAQPRFSRLLIGSFAALASTSTLVGLYATVAYLVAQRRCEIGIRLAMGANRGDIRRMVLRQGAGLIAAGVAVGAVGALATSRLAPLLTIASLAAVLVPAQRAAAVEPGIALRLG